MFQKAHKMTIESWWLRHVWLYLNRVLLLKHQSNQMFSKLYVWLVSSDETQLVLYVSKRQFCIDSLMHIQTWSTEKCNVVCVTHVSSQIMSSNQKPGTYIKDPHSISTTIESQKCPFLPPFNFWYKKMNRSQSICKLLAQSLLRHIET